MRRTNVLIAGGGVSGLTTAYELSTETVPRRSQVDEESVESFGQELPDAES